MHLSGIVFFSKIAAQYSWLIGYMLKNLLSHKTFVISYLESDTASENKIRFHTIRNQTINVEHLDILQKIQLRRPLLMDFQ